MNGDMNQSRREFLRRALAGAGLAAVGPACLSAEIDVSDKPLPPKATARVKLGKTSIRPSFLAQGTGFKGYNHSSAQTRMGKQAFDRLLRHGLDRGISFIDMADLYGSHPFVRDVIKGIPREKLVLLSKIWPRKASWNTPSGGAKAEVNRFRKELGVDYLDICLIHCVTNDRWPEEYKRIRDELSELKEQGAVRAVGISCHDFKALQLAARHPWIDVIMARINHKGGAKFKCDNTAAAVARVLKEARANGKAVVGMKIFGEGTLTKPEEKDASIRFVIRERLVDAMTIGMLKPEEVDDTISRINRALAA